MVDKETRLKSSTNTELKEKIFSLFIIQECAQNKNLSRLLVNINVLGL